MTTNDILKKVRKLEIKSRGLSAELFSGQYHSAFKGRGMSFSEVREYQQGDDIRTIDWNVTARFGNPYVKVFEEERELTLMLLVDVSGSKDFGNDVFGGDVFGFCFVGEADAVTKHIEANGAHVFGNNISAAANKCVGLGCQS